MNNPLSASWRMEADIMRNTTRSFIVSFVLGTLVFGTASLGADRNWLNTPPIGGPSTSEPFFTEPPEFTPGDLSPYGNSAANPALNPFANPHPRNTERCLERLERQLDRERQQRQFGQQLHQQLRPRWDGICRGRISEGYPC